MRSLPCVLSIAGVLTGVSPVDAQSPASGQPLFEDRAEAYHAFVLGRSLEGAGDIDGAVSAYERAAELDPAASDIWAELSALYARRNRPERGDRGRQRRA